MHHFTAIALLSAVTAALAFPSKPLVRESVSQRFSCGSNPSSEKRLQAEENFRKIKSDERRTKAKEGPIPVYWNVIYEDLTYEGGLLEPTMINDQIDVLNADYAAAGFSFELQNITYIENALWFQNMTDETPMEVEMKSTYRHGGANALNIYTVSFSNSSLLGYAAFPADYTSDPIHDGIVLNWSTLPGGSSADYSMGKTLTHETGHWTGLYHTFQGGCEEEDGGDLVSDTPVQANATEGCPVKRDSCTEQIGLDPIHNYMDYSSDVCLTEFSKGQIKRAQEQMEAYRGVAASQQYY
ncbi:zincin [Cylindrobasidium torrendii FP15055 ss-10]|uniref:Zincin n=1 Tax=Cylindrobasidium torrendii FP15055 ss-10 TaxID=1314674 RepID=A0A0D7BA47_9AGAR|nr:zincin [Cylindrobasidium torrendii FP15055 ss-10]